jgi:hypothetical protein
VKIFLKMVQAYSLKKKKKKKKKKNTHMGLKFRLYRSLHCVLLIGCHYITTLEVRIVLGLTTELINSSIT